MAVVRDNVKPECRAELWGFALQILVPSQSGIRNLPSQLPSCSKFLGHWVWKFEAEVHCHKNIPLRTQVNITEGAQVGGHSSSR